MKSIEDIAKDNNINESSYWWLQELQRAGAGQYTIKALTSINHDNLTVSDLAEVLTEVYRDLKRR
jgi:hypothetical protein